MVGCFFQQMSPKKKVASLWNTCDTQHRFTGKIVPSLLPTPSPSLRAVPSRPVVVEAGSGTCSPKTWYHESIINISKTYHTVNSYIINI